MFSPLQVFHAPLRTDKLSPELKDGGMRKVVGYNTPTWYSPATGPAVFAPYADIIAKRDASRTPNGLRKLKWRCLSRLVDSSIAIRKAGTDDSSWMLGCGNIEAVVALAWPCVSDGNGRLIPRARHHSDKPQFLTITEASDWEAVLVDIVSPMHSCIIQEDPTTRENIYKDVDLNESSHYGKVTVVAIVRCAAKPLLQIQAKVGFRGLPMDYMKLLGEHLCGFDGCYVV